MILPKDIISVMFHLTSDVYSYTLLLVPTALWHSVSRIVFTLLVNTRVRKLHASSVDYVLMAQFVPTIKWHSNVVCFPIIPFILHVPCLVY